MEPVIVIGFSAPYPLRAAMIHWFKQQYPNIPVVPAIQRRRELPRGRWRQRVRRPRRLAGRGREHPQKPISLQLIVKWNSFGLKFARRRFRH